MLAANLKEWSRLVRDRDGKCVRCGSLEKLHAHHIKRKSEFPELKLSLSNGETLCVGCHAKEHESDFPGLVRETQPHPGPRKTAPKKKAPRIPIESERVIALEKAISVLTKQNLALLAEIARLKKESAQ